MYWTGFRLKWTCHVRIPDESFDGRLYHDGPFNTGLLLDARRWLCNYLGSMAVMSLESYWRLSDSRNA